jgi:hypothetical protein
MRLTLIFDNIMVLRYNITITQKLLLKFLYNLRIQFSNVSVIIFGFYITSPIFTTSDSTLLLRLNKDGPVTLPVSTEVFKQKLSCQKIFIRFI